MPSSLPVPSKAALTALRGLVLGTSCTLALIAEDRRRKINHAIRVVENGQKIKSARGYRAGSSALAVALEEEAAWDPSLLSLPLGSLELHQHSTGQTTNPTRQSREPPAESTSRDRAEDLAESVKKEFATGGEVVVSKQSDVSNTVNQARKPSKAAKKAKGALPQGLSAKKTTPLRTSPNWVSANKEVIESFAFPTNDEIVAKVHKACDAADSRQISTALRFVLEAMAENLAPDNQNQPWIEATAKLCRTCQETGRIGDGVKLLARVVARGPLAESAYLDHGPLSLINSMLAHGKSNELPQDIYLKNLDTAINLFLPTFTEPPVGLNPGVYRVGRKLMEAAFSADRLKRVIGLYRRCYLVAGKDAGKLTSWFLTKLYEKHEYKSAIQIFLSTFAKTSPNEESIRAIGDIIVHSVESAHTYRAAEILKALHSICSGSANTKLSLKWVMKLLVSHWSRHSNFDEIEALFAHLQTTSLADTVVYSEHLYRVMVELALEAGEEDKAESYFRAAVAQNSRLASDIRLLAVFARFHAKNGDWEGVRAAFGSMAFREGVEERSYYGRTFVQVLKEYSQGHSIHDTETFLKLYTDELEVPLCNYTVTVMAKRYAAVRDVDSLLDWLEYCSSAGFPIDAAFTNSILVSCRREWKFPFNNLRTLFRKIRALNPNFIDKVTERVIADAALSDSNARGKAAKGRLLSLRIEQNKLPAQNKCAPVKDVVLAMKEALACHHPRSALRIYKRALHLGMPFSQYALRLAVQAQLQWKPDCYKSANAHIQKAEAAGEDVTKAVNYLLAMKLGRISATTDNKKAFQTVEATLAQFQHAGTKLNENSLHRAALICLAAGHHRCAISYALKAAELRGPPTVPCFNLQNFKILLAAYAELVDIDGLRDTIDRALTNAYREDNECRSELRHARKRLMHSRATSASYAQRMRAVDVVNDRLAVVVGARAWLREEGKILEQESLQIMKRAAEDMGCEPVDFDDIPWLGGGKADTLGGERGEERSEEAADGLLDANGGDYYVKIQLEMERNLNAVAQQERESMQPAAAAIAAF